MSCKSRFRLPLCLARFRLPLCLARFRLPLCLATSRVRHARLHVLRVISRGWSASEGAGEATCVNELDFTCTDPVYLVRELVIFVSC